MANEQDVTTVTDVDEDGNEISFDITTAAPEGEIGSEIVTALFDGEQPDGEVVYTDIDHDGTMDTGAADTDGDGQLDAIASDTDADGHVDAISVDTDGDGKLDAIGMDTDADGQLDAIGIDADGDGNIETAAMDTDGDGEFDQMMTDSDGDGIADETSDISAALPTDDEVSTNSIEFTVGEDGYPVTDDAAAEEYTIGEPEDAGITEMGDPVYAAAADTTYGSGDFAAAGGEIDAVDTEGAEQAAHTDAAREAQTAADEFVEKGDYAAAAEAREVAENEAYAGGDDSMLGTSDASDLENAAYRQDVAGDYRAQQAEHIAAGDYAAAQEDAQNAAYQTSDADYLSGGTDHTGQSDQDAYNLGNAVYDEKQADYFQDNADWYANAGNADAAQSSMDHAAQHQESADASAATANPASVMYDVDASSTVAGGGGYDMAAVDTGMDAGTVDVAPVSYDTGTDDGTV